jgi:uncharacterized protein YwqG
MYQAKDGKKFGSKFAGRKYDSVHGGEEKMDEKHEEAEKPEFEMGEKEGAEEGKDEQEMHPVVAEHGKAHKVHIHHDHARGKHHVTTMHEDGHVNESDHASAQEAHGEGAKLAGVEAPSQENEEQGNPAASAMSSTPQGME